MQIKDDYNGIYPFKALKANVGNLKFGPHWTEACTCQIPTSHSKHTLSGFGNSIQSLWLQSNTNITPFAL
jgi:hypothetical protein